MKKKNKFNYVGVSMILVMLIVAIIPLDTFATSVIPNIKIELGQSNSPQELSTNLQMILLLTVLALAPSILIMMTAFTRIVIALHFLKSAMGTQQTPPNQVLIGLALFLTFFVMSPVFSNIKTNAIDPYQAGQITQQVALDRGTGYLKEFMLRQTRDEDINLFMELAGREPLQDDTQLVQDLPMHIVIPAFIINELRAGFIIGFLLYIPFIVIDMVVSSTLMAMGMMMLPPMMIALPFKLLLFILVDGWHLLIGQLVQTFR